MTRLTCAALLIASGCASTTIINTNPEGAQVLIDGAPRGNTPFTFTETVNATTQHALTLRLPGYQDLNTLIAASAWNPGKVVVSALFCLPGLFFSSEYPPAYTFSLLPANGAQPYPQPYSPQELPPPGAGYPPPPPPNYPPPPPPPLGG